MNKLNLFAAAAAFIAVLLLFYAPPHSTAVYAVWRDGVYVKAQGSLPYVEGPGWYWLDMFWLYYNETIHCEPCPQDNVWCATECEVVHVLYPEVLSSVVSGTCSGLTIVDFRVDDTEGVYHGTIIYPQLWWFYTFCQTERELHPECYPYAALSHKWVIGHAKWASVGGEIYTLVYVDSDLNGTILYRLKVEKESWPSSSAPYNTPTLVSTKNLTLVLTSIQWWVYTPSGQKFSMPYSPKSVAIVDYGYYLNYPRGTFYWLVYVPEGCRLYIPYPASYELAVITPR